MRVYIQGGKDATTQLPETLAFGGVYLKRNSVLLVFFTISGDKKWFYVWDLKVTSWELL